MLCSSLRLSLAALALGWLAACNFQPVYGPGGAGAEVRDQIAVAAPATRIEFELVARLEDRLGIGTRYRLDYDLATAQSNIVIDGAEDVNRVNIAGQLSYRLTDAATGAPVDAGEVSTFTAYATTASPVATAAARRDAEDRLMIALADQLVTRLLARAPGWP